MSLKDIVGTGIIYGHKLNDLFNYAKEHKFAIPSVCISNISTINAALETAQNLNSPIILQVSHHSSHYIAGFGFDNKDHIASVKGSISAAFHVHTIADMYDIPIVLHTDHANKEKLPWIDELINYAEKFSNLYKKPLFSSHMIDLSEEPIEENIEKSIKYFQKLKKLNMGIEVELGPSQPHNQECNKDSNKIDNSKIYTLPCDVEKFYNELIKIDNNFLLSVAFGNQYGIQTPGTTLLNPMVLDNIQKYIAQKFETSSKPLNLVFHGGSGAMQNDIFESISFGVVKYNIDTDLQWAFWNGVRKYYLANEAYLKGQIGNPEGADKPNKSKYDPRTWLRFAQTSFKERLVKTFENLNCINVL